MATYINLGAWPQACSDRGRKERRLGATRKLDDVKGLDKDTLRITKTSSRKLIVKYPALRVQSL